MKISTVRPAPPPDISMTFPRTEGWAIVSALRDYVKQHPDAAHVDEWAKWADDLDRELRRA